MRRFQRIHKLAGLYLMLIHVHKINTSITSIGNFMTSLGGKIPVVFASTLVESGALPWPPGVTEFIIPTRSLQVSCNEKVNTWLRFLFSSLSKQNVCCSSLLSCAGYCGRWREIFGFAFDHCMLIKWNNTNWFGKMMGKLRNR